ncbi:MAG: TatD family deoxyribonuclease [Gammaproteobacteria bacterium]|nr:MAG: TatD family deoxyribonuclease [Gammaproteobacteria bacterium]
MLVDSHCHLDHLDLSDYHNSLPQLLDAARQRGVEQFLSVGVDLKSSSHLVELAQTRDDILVSVGVHPLQRELPPLPEVSELLSLGRSRNVVAIGETGLDNYYDKDNTEWQEQSFIRHLQAGAELQKPVIVHTREAREQTLAILRGHASTTSGGVIHCFTENWEMAKAAMDLNFLISFSGIITFRNAAALREVVSKVPLEKMLVETDAPWLAPVPFRGKQNEPKYVVEVAKAVAEVKGVDWQEVAEVTSANFRRLFLSTN